MFEIQRSINKRYRTIAMAYGLEDAYVLLNQHTATLPMGGALRVVRQGSTIAQRRVSAGTLVDGGW